MLRKRGAEYLNKVKPPQLTLYTDGSCPVPQGPGGWAFILTINNKTVRRTGTAESTTNNRMELMPVIEALKLLPKPCRVKIVSDSKYLLDGVSNWMHNWQRNDWRRMVTERNEKGKKCSKLVEVKNVDLWKELYDLYKYHTIETVWVRGHNGHPENEWCDQAAGEAVDRLKNAGLAIQ